MPTVFGHFHQRFVSYKRTVCEIETLKPWAAVSNRQEHSIRQRLDVCDIKSLQVLVALYQNGYASVCQIGAVRQRQPFNPLAMHERLNGSIADFVVQSR